jgi:hypothetical protein
MVTPNAIVWQPVGGGNGDQPKGAFFTDGGIDLAQEELLVQGVDSHTLVVDESGVYWLSGGDVLRVRRSI